MRKNDVEMTLKQEIIYYVSLKLLMWRMPPLMPYGFPNTRWKRILQSVFWFLETKYDFPHGNPMIGHRLINKHIPSVTLNNFKKKDWGFGIKWDNGDWVHYSFAYHPWHYSFRKAWEHYKLIINSERYKMGSVSLKPIWSTLKCRLFNHKQAYVLVNRQRWATGSALFTPLTSADGNDRPMFVFEKVEWYI